MDRQSKIWIASLLLLTLLLAVVAVSLVGIQKAVCLQSDPFGFVLDECK